MPLTYNLRLNKNRYIFLTKYAKSVLPPLPVNSGGFQTVIKEMIFKYIGDIYLTNIGVTKYEMNLVDLISGSGLVKISDRRYGRSPIITGSTMNAVKIIKSKNVRQFDNIYTNDLNTKFTKALAYRLNYINRKSRKQLFNNLYPLSLDVNLAINNILPKIDKVYQHSLIILDPDRMVLDFTSVNRLANRTNSDFLIFLPSLEYIREIVRYKKKPNASYGRLTNFCGDSLLDVINRTPLAKINSDWLARIFAHQLTIIPDMNGKLRNQVSIIGIPHFEKAKKQNYAHVIYLSKTTLGGSRYMRAIGELEQSMKNISDKQILAILEHMYEKQKDLFDYFQ